MGMRTRDQCHLFINSIINHPIGCVGVTLPIYVKKNKAVISLEREANNGKRYIDKLCLFRCLALHRGSDVRRLEPAVKTLYKAHNQDNIPIEEFAGVTLNDLYRVDSTFEMKVCVYKLVKSDDAEDGKSTTELVRRSLCYTPKQCTFTRRIFPSSRMYACTVTRIDVGSVVTRYGNTHRS